MKRIIRELAINLLSYLPLKNIIIFESHSDFCDNSRVLFEYMISRNLNTKYEMIWVVENPSNFKNNKIENVKFIKLNPKTWIGKLRYALYLASAKYGFYSHRIPPIKLNKGEVFVNLWHGAPLKNINFCDLGFNFDYVLYSSDFYKDFYIDLLNCKDKQLLLLGNPRTDLLFLNLNESSKLKIEKSNKIIMWMPTYRVHKDGFKGYKDNDKLPFGIPIFYDNSQFEDINNILKENNMSLIIKLHPAEDLSMIKFISYSNIKILTNRELDDRDVQLYSLLGETDALITDYSSVYVDYLLTKKPIAFTIDDMDDYKTGYIFEDPLNYMPGKHIENYEGFREFILDVARSNDEYYKKRIEINTLLNNYKDGRLSKRIVEYFDIN